MNGTGMRDLFLLDPGTIFLNHGSFGACPRQVFERYQEWQVQLERQPVAFLDPERGYRRWMAETRRALANDLGTNADDLVGCVNATHGLNIVARSLPLEPGDEILMTDHEYAATQKTWDFVARNTGAKLVYVAIPLPLTEAAQFNDAVIGAMTDRTRVLFASHITSPTSLAFPLETVIEEARHRGIYTVIDGAHAPGHVSLDLDRLGADFYCGNCHKWMMAPKGAGFLHARKEHQPMLDPLVISHGWQGDRMAEGPFGGSPFVDAMEIQGTRDPSAWLTVPEALRFRREQGLEEAAGTCSDLAHETAGRLLDLCRTEPLSSREYSAPLMVSVPVPTKKHAWLQRELHDRHRIEIPVVRWNASSCLRLSVQCYNTRAEMDLLIEAVASLLKLPDGT